MANEIVVTIKGDDQLSGSLDKAKHAAGGFGDTMKTVAGTAAGFLAGGAIQAGLGQITGLMSGAVEQSTKLGEGINAVQKIFGASSQTILDWGKANATSFGLSQASFNELATPLGAALKNAGLSMDEVSGTTIDLTKRAADMASVFNVDVKDAMGAIQAGLRGEGDPLERFGVGLSAAAVEAKALSMGLGKSNVDLDKVKASTLGAQIAQAKYTEAVKKHGAGSIQAASAQKTLIGANESLEKATAGSNAVLSDQEKTQARIALLMEQTNAVAGDFTQTSGSYANAQRIAAAKTEELQAKLGDKLIPVMQKVTQVKLALTSALVDKAVPAFEKVASVVNGRVVPVLRDFGDRAREVIVGTVIPALREFAGWVAAHIVPAVVTLADVMANTVYPALAQVIGFLASHRETLIGIAVAIGVGLVAAFLSWAAAAGAAAIATIAAAAPVIAIGVAIAALAAGIIYAYEHWGWFKTAVDAVAHFMADILWPILKDVGRWIGTVLVPVIADIAVWIGTHLPGAIMAAVGFFKTLGLTIADVAVAVYNFVASAISKFWELVVFVYQLPGHVADAARGMWDSIWEAAVGLVDAVKSKLNDLVDFVRAIPGRVAGAARDILGSIPGAGTVGGIIGRVPGLASGGIVTRPTLALIGESGPEAVIPLRGGGPGGGQGVTIIVQAMDQRGVSEAVVRGLRDARRFGLTSVNV